MLLPQKVKISSYVKGNGPLNHIKTDGKVYCPYTLLRNYLEVRPKRLHVDEQFFVFSDTSTVTPYHMRSVLKIVLTNAGYDAELFSTHSCRIGRACDHLKYGLTVETIKKLGRWRLNAVFTYLWDM